MWYMVIDVDESNVAPCIINNTFFCLYLSSWKLNSTSNIYLDRIIRHAANVRYKGKRLGRFIGFTISHQTCSYRRTTPLGFLIHSASGDDWGWEKKRSTLQWHWYKAKAWSCVKISLWAFWDKANICWRLNHLVGEFNCDRLIRCGVPAYNWVSAQTDYKRLTIEMSI